MQITSTLTNRSKQVLNVVYNDIDGELELGEKKIQGVHAYCFYGDKLVLVYTENKKYWTPPGGKVEEGETVSDAVCREVKEETNMRVIKQCLIGYQDITEPQGMITQTRSVCIVEPYGPFVSDVGGDITKIELIDPKDYKKYFDWGEIGDHIMARALEIKSQMDLEFN
jgi:ADP-ribose pyrophosphatase YjhB (NUDIX family)